MKKRTLIALLFALLLTVSSIAFAACSTGNNSGDSSSIADSSSVDSRQLAAPANLKLDGNVVSWDAVKNADYYDIYVNNKFEKTVSTTSYTIVRTEQGTYSITIGALSIGNRYDASEMSDPIDYIVATSLLGTPVISINGSKVSWNAVEGATSYEIYVGGEKLEGAIVAEENGVCSWIAEITELGSHVITVKALSDSDDYTDEGDMSNEVKYLVLDQTVYHTSETPVSFANTEALVIAPENHVVANENLKANQVLKVAYYVTPGELTELVANSREGYSLFFKPVLVHADGSTLDGGTITTYGGIRYWAIESYDKVVFSYIIQLPMNFAATDKIQLALDANTGMDFVIDKVVVAGAGYDFGVDEEYVLVDERKDVLVAGALTLKDGEFISSTHADPDNFIYNVIHNDLDIVGKPTFHSPEPSIYGGRYGGSDLLVPGQVVKFAAYINVTSITNTNYTDTTGWMYFGPTIWDNASNGVLASNACIFEYSQLKLGKNLLVGVGVIPETFQGADLNYMTLRWWGVYEGITFTQEKFVIAGADYDFGKDGEYQLMYELALPAGMAPVDGSWTPSSESQTLATPSLSLNESVVTWDAVENATGYIVYVNGVAVGEAQTGTTYTFASNLAPGSYKIKVEAIDANGSYCSTMSEEIEYIAVEPAGPITILYSTEVPVAFDDTEPQIIAPANHLVSGENLSAGQVLKVAYYVTPGTLSELNAYSASGYSTFFKPVLVHADNTTEDGGTITTYGGIRYWTMAAYEKVVFVYIIQLPVDFVSTDSIQLAIDANTGMDFVIDKVVVAYNEYDFGNEDGYMFIDEREDVLVAGALTISGGEYVKSVNRNVGTMIYNTIHNKVDILGEEVDAPDAEPPFYGGRFGGSGLLQPGQVVKFAAYVDIHEITNTEYTNTTGWMYFGPTIWRNSDNAILASNVCIFEYSQLKEGKVLLVGVGTLPTSFEGIDKNYFTLRWWRVWEGISFTVEKFVIAGADYDFGLDSEYELMSELPIVDAMAPAEGSWTPSTKAAE